MPYFLGNYETDTKARINLIYYKEPPQNVIDNHDAMLQGEEPEKESLKDKKALLYMDTDTEEIFYEYIDKELTPEELTQRDMSWLAQISTRSQVINDQLTDAELIKLGEMYPDWETGVDYEVDNVISYHNELYKVIQAHTSQSSWTPDTAESLFMKVAPDGVIAEWSQPTGAHDAYDTGDQVTHNGSTWESEIDANTYEPGVYGWTEL